MKLKTNRNFVKRQLVKEVCSYLSLSHLGGGVTVLGTVKGAIFETVVSAGTKVTLFSVVSHPVLSHV